MSWSLVHAAFLWALPILSVPVLIHFLNRHRVLTHRFAVEIAETDDQRRQGLMFRERMHPNAGMLFDYGSPQVVEMWMKNTYIPLDMIFIGAAGKIQHIVERTVPHSLQAISSQKRVRSVLEVNAGTVLRLGLRVGDLVRHPIFNN